MFANADPSQYRRVAPDRGIATNSGRQANPVLCGLQRPILVYGAGVHIVDKHDTVTYKDAVLDREARAEEAVTRDFAVCADFNISLNLYEWPDPGSASNPTAIKIHKIRLINHHIRSERHIG